MSHFLSSDKYGYSRFTTKPYACVKVQTVRVGRKVQLQIVPENSIFVMKVDTGLRQLPKDIPIVGPDGEVCAASGEFFVTTETFDPYHLVIDALDGNRPF